MTPLGSPRLTIANDADTRPRFVRWVCIGCEHEWKGHPVPNYCRECGMREGYAPIEIDVKGDRSDDLGTLRRGVEVADWLPALPTGLPLGFSMLLRGRPGAGKSRTAYRFAGSLGTVIVYALEMGKLLSLVTAEQAGATVVRFWWYDEVALDDLEVIDPAVVVVDSIQKLGRDRRRVVTHLRRWALEHAKNVIFVSQLNAKGTSRHSEEDDFDCDFVCDVEPSRMDGVQRKEIHGFESKATECRDKCAHVVVRKSRIPDCNPVAFDVPIVR